MAIFSLAARTSVVTAANANWTAISSSTNAFKALEIGLTLNAATATTQGIGTPAAAGATPTSPVTFLAEDTGNTTAAGTTAATAWTTMPTTPANFFRRVSLPGTIGGGIIWTFPRGITILKGSLNLCIWNIAIPPVMDVWMVIDE